MPHRAGPQRPPHLHGDIDGDDADDVRAANDERYSARPRRGFADSYSGGGGVLGLIVRTYGPYAFSLVSLLAIWYFIVGPTIAANRVDMVDLKKVAEANASTAESMEKTAKALNEALGRFNTIRKNSGGGDNP